VNILEAIVSEHYRRLESCRENFRQWRKAAFQRSDFRPFSSALRQEDGLAIIAEVKRASPSAGQIAPAADSVLQAQRYEEGGAKAISVLTEVSFFRGSPEDLPAVRQGTTRPLLRKDFVLEEVDLWESVALGADAVLLIARLLPPARLRKLHSLALSFGLSVLVEVHNREELWWALDSGARILGINNRDLATFTVDLHTTEELISEIPEECIAVAESGVTREEQVQWLRTLGVDAVLVGEALMRASDPVQKLVSFRRAGKGGRGMRREKGENVSR
jgi:indole-3-glycerol phosphate synthase